MRTFRTLELAVEFYSQVETLKISSHLRGQLLRAAASVSLNLSEGNAKFSFKDKARIYQIAMGSLRESQTALRLAKIDDPKLNQLADHLGASIYKLMKASDAKVEVKN